jgi:hypothetical protein
MYQNSSCNTTFKIKFEDQMLAGFTLKIFFVDSFLARLYPRSSAEALDRIVFCLQILQGKICKQKYQCVFSMASMVFFTVPSFFFEKTLMTNHPEPETTFNASLTSLSLSKQELTTG